MSISSKFKKGAIAAAAFIMAFSACMFSACTNNSDDSSYSDNSSASASDAAVAELDLLEENIVNDNYANYYEIFVYSFCDSDGDGYGDLNGVTEKLSYIRDLGYTGIWLMPICPSPSYHKYDVTDYYDIDSLYGDMDDFETLISEAHTLGISVILDLVVNHTSSSHEWFKASAKAHINGDTNNTYYDWYNFSTSSQTGYNKYPSSLGTIYYESRFDSGMPDLNLDCQAVRDEIENIIEFWIGKGADGFRLDACTSYYTDSSTSSQEFCDWISTTIKSYKEDAFIVGEVWEGIGTIKEYSAAAPEMSFFAFPVSTSSSSSSYIYKATLSSESSKNADNYYSSCGNVISMASGGIPVPFLDNHDMNRVAGLMSRDENRIKFAYGLLSIYNGTAFTYYGDEIGMIGSGSDPNRRIGMLWSTDGATTIAPSGTTSTEYCFDGVEEQLADEGSILNYYKQANNLRNAFPEIARGELSRTSYDNNKVLIMHKTYNNSTITIIINFDTSEQTVEGDYGTLQKGLCAYRDTSVTQSGTTLTLPAYSIAVLK
ncbi:MAG: alpha-amylase [Clostridia bacterium]|nr:alpha-amylase [Clostridia bacterium]